MSIICKIFFISFNVAISTFFSFSSFAEEISYSKVTAIKSNGKSSKTTFQLGVVGLASSSRITTSDSSNLTIKIFPAAEDIGKKADIYNAVLVNQKEWWMLDTNGTYIPWNISLKKLEPFQEEVTLEEAIALDFISGKFNVTGELRYFFAYVVEGTNYFVASPKAFRLNIISDSTGSQDEALSLYKNDVEEQIVQSKCIVCHVDGGLARNSDLRFSQRNELSAENNFDILKTFLGSREGDINYILENASGERGHPGGAQITKNSSDYKVFENILRSILGENPYKSINFGTSIRTSTDEANIFDGVVLESKEKTLRRASLILAGRLPTDEEIIEVIEGDESDFDKVILGLMEGE
jgi:hypothetical protein